MLAISPGEGAPSLKLENITTVGVGAAIVPSIEIRHDSNLILSCPNVKVDTSHAILMYMDDTTRLAKLTVQGTSASDTVARITLTNYCVGGQIEVSSGCTVVIKSDTVGTARNINANSAAINSVNFI